MATATEVQDWLNVNRPYFLTYLQGEGEPTGSPLFDFAIYKDKLTNESYSWNTVEWKKGIGGGGSFESVLVTDATELIAEPSQNYILSSDAIANKNIVINTDNFNEIGQAFQITDAGFISTSVTITINPTANITINGISDSIIFDVQDGMIELTMVAYDGANGTMMLKSYGTSKTSEAKPTSFVNSSFEAINKQYMVDCSGGSITATIPNAENFDSGQIFSIYDYTNSSETNNVLVDFTTNGYKLNGIVQNYIFNTNGAMAKFIYINETVGFNVISGQF